MYCYCGCGQPADWPSNYAVGHWWGMPVTADEHRWIKNTGDRLLFQHIVSEKPDEQDHN